MNLFDNLLNCPDEQGWINPNISRAQKLEKIAEKFAIDFYEWRSTTPIKNIDQFTNEETIKIFKDERNL
jgi:hypothetical protein